MKRLGTVCILSMSLVASLNAGEVSTTPSRNSFSRPEERGQQYTNSTIQELVQLLKTSTDTIEQRKLANELGNRSIKGGLELSPEQAQAVRVYADKQLDLANNPDSNVRSESRCQIDRLWLAAVPACLDAVTDTKNTKRMELAGKSLTLMKNREVILALVRKGEQANDPVSRSCIYWALENMKRQRTTVVPNRSCIDQATSDKLYEELVVPALANLKKRGITPL